MLGKLLTHEASFGGVPKILGATDCACLSCAATHAVRGVLLCGTCGVGANWDILLYASLDDIFVSCRSGNRWVVLPEFI